MDVYALFDILVDLLVTRPTEYLNNLATRRSEDWDYYLNLVMSKIGNIIPNTVVPILEEILANHGKRKEIIEILTSIKYQNSYDLVIKICNQYQDLTEKEVVLIDEFKKEHR